jgi:hypothetical protein
VPVGFGVKRRGEQAVHPSPDAVGASKSSRAEHATGTRVGCVAQHPILTSVLVACTLVGAALGYFLLGEELSVARRLVGGAFGGAGVGLLVTAVRMIG